jgi:methyl-accepting chemotaxis protein
MGMTIPVASEEDSLGIAMTRMQGAIVGVMTTVKDLARASEAGDMQKRGDPDMFSGEFKNIIIELNNTLDSVMTPVNEAMRLAGSYAKGDFTDRMNNDLIVKGDFIPFKEALNQIGIQGNRAVGGVKSDIEKLSSEMEGTGASAAEIAKTAGVLAESSHSVSSLAGKSGNAITQTLSAMEDLTRTVSSVAEKSDSASRMASKTVELSDSGSKLAGNAETGMEGIMHAVQETSSIMNDITGQMDEIGKIVDLISGIAEQTGLLALNAAIEAARAGDAGRGFAVVADEVKALALDSQRSAENISSIIKNLQNKSQMGSESMKNSALEVEKGNEAVRATLKVFDQIVEAVNQVHNNMAEVAAATEEQAAAVEEITASVSEVGILIQETAQEAAGSAASTQEVTSLIEQITAAIVTANMAIENIADEMGIFTTVKNEKRQETR